MGHPVIAVSFLFLEEVRKIDRTWHLILVFFLRAFSIPLASPAVISYVLPVIINIANVTPWVLPHRQWRQTIKALWHRRANSATFIYACALLHCMHIGKEQILCILTLQIGWLPFYCTVVLVMDLLNRVCTLDITAASLPQKELQGGSSSYSSRQILWKVELWTIT